MAGSELNAKKALFLLKNVSFSDELLTSLKSRGSDCLVGAPVNLPLVRDVTDNDKRLFFAARSLVSRFYGVKRACLIEHASLKTPVWVYVFRNPKAELEATQSLNKQLDAANKRWLAGELPSDDPLWRFFKKPAQTEGSRQQLEYELDLIDQECYTKGFFVFASTQDLPIEEALDLYNLRSEVERTSAAMLSTLLKSVPQNSPAIYDGALFITAIALNILLLLRGRVQTVCKSARPRALLDLVNMLQQLHLTINENNQPVLVGLSARLKEALDRMEMSPLFESATTVQYLLTAKKV